MVTCIVLLCQMIRALRGKGAEKLLFYKYNERNIHCIYRCRKKIYICIQEKKIYNREQ